MNCKFCGDDKKLIKAHCIPWSFFKPAQKKGVAKVLHRNPNRFPKRSPKGVYDSEIVCEDCEKKFQLYDEYAKQFFLDEFESHIVETVGSENQFLKIEKYDYQKLRLFFISVLWRASVSRQQFYRQVSLGEKYELWLKNLIEKKDPGDFRNFSMMIRKFSIAWIEKGIISPTRYRFKDLRLKCYNFFLGKFAVTIKVDRNSFPKDYEALMLKPDPPLIVGVQKIETLIELNSFMEGRLNRNNF